MMQLYFTLLAIPVGLLVMLSLSYAKKAHLKSVGDLLLFFFKPYPPTRMFTVIELDGTSRVYYDDEFSEIHSNNKNMIKTVHGDLYITEFPFTFSKSVVSMYDARGPKNVISPMGLSWRWVLSSSFTFYFFYLAFIFELLAEQFNPGSFIVYTMIFFGYGMWFFTNIVRLADNTIEYAWYFEYGITPPYRKIIPVPGFSSINVIQFLSALEEIRIVVPETLKSFIDQLSKDIGGENMAAVIAAKLSIAEQWRKMLAKVLRNAFRLRKAGEADAMLRLNISSQPKLIYIVAALVIGLVVGYFLGNIFTFTVGPPPQPIGNGTFVEPAVPPQPPGGGQGQPIEPPSPPPPPGGGGENPIQPPNPPPPP